MATGRVDFFRRRESPKYPRRDSNDYCRSGDVRRGGEGGARCRDDRGLRKAVENGRGVANGGGRAVEMVTEKKRKFLPIIWDKDEKKARMLKSCGVIPALAVPASSPRKRSSSEVRDVVSNESAVQLLPEKMMSPVAIGREEKKVRITSKNRVVKVEAVLSPLLAQNNATTRIQSQRVETSVSPAAQIQSLGAKISVSATAQIQSAGVKLSACEATVVDGLVEISQTEAPAEVHTPKPLSDVNENDQTRVPTSKWATYMYSPSDDDSCNSTPESGEIRREDSVCSKSRTSSSVGATNSIGAEEIDGVDQEVDAGGEQLYPDSDEDDTALPQIEDSPVPRGRSTNMLNGCRSVAEFAKLDGMLGEGTYGVVYKARDNKTGEIVAIKKVKMDKFSEGGFPITSLREMNILLACNHPSIVDVKEVVHNGDDIFMVMECMDYELKLLTEATKQPFSIGEVKYLVKKYLVKSLLEGVKYLHDNWVLHRDLKTSNLLMNKEGELKICDFGLSRLYGSPLKQYTSEVVTLWYRAPELLLGQKKYSTGIDMWSVGCIMAELLAREALFPGKSEVEQLDKIFKTLGTPTETDWPGVSSLPGFTAIKVKQRENLLRKKFAGTCFTGAPMLSSSGLDMLTKLLTFDPAQRISADDALKHDWFKDYPEPRPFKPSSTVHDRYMALRQRQEREHLARARRGKC